MKPLPLTKETAGQIDQIAEGAERELAAIVSCIQSADTEGALHHAKYVRANLLDLSAIARGVSQNWPEAAAHFCQEAR